MANPKYGKNMLLITSYWGNADTFKLIPIADDCPYAEVIYDPATTLLVVISKIEKENFQMVIKLDSDGNPIQAKKPKANGKPYAEQRSRLNTLQEYYLPEKEEQEEFVKSFAVNADSFDFKRFMKDLDAPDIMQSEQTLSLVDENGLPLKK
jgi:hypothetical protein